MVEVFIDLRQGQPTEYFGVAWIDQAALLQALPAHALFQVEVVDDGLWIPIHQLWGLDVRKADLPLLPQSLCQVKCEMLLLMIPQKVHLLMLQPVLVLFLHDFGSDQPPVRSILDVHLVKVVAVSPKLSMLCS